MAVHANNGAHEVDNVVGCKRLVLVRLADVFVKSREEEVEQILPLRRLVVDVGENAAFDKFKDFLEFRFLQITNTLGINHLLLQDDHFLGLVEAFVEQSLKYGLDTASDLSCSQALVFQPVLQRKKAGPDKLAANPRPNAVAVQELIERVGTLDNGDLVVPRPEMDVDVFLHRADGLLDRIDMGIIDDARTVLPYAHIIRLGRRKNGYNLLCIRQL